MILTSKQYFLVLAAILLFVGTAASANEKVVVIPLEFAATASNLKNVTTVSAQGGDFETVEGALNSIDDAALDNRYLIVIGPGDYVVKQSLVLSGFVNISGSGRNSTRLIPEIAETNVPFIEGGFGDSLNFRNDMTPDLSQVVISDLTIDHRLSSRNKANTVIEWSNREGTRLVVRNTNMYVSQVNRALGGTVTGVSGNGVTMEFDNSTLDIDCLSCSDIQGIFATNLSVVGLLSGSSIDLTGGITTSVVGVLQSDSLLSVDTSEITVDGGPSIAIDASSFSLGVDGSVIQRSTIITSDTSSNVRTAGTAISVNANDGPFYSVSQSSIAGAVLQPTSGSVACVSSDDRKGNPLDRSCNAIVTIPVP